MTQKKQTAVEWLYEQLPIRMKNYLQEEIIKAKAMHKKEIMDAYNKGEFNDGMNETAEQYYTETYNND